ncbi:MAG TPA: hypothetical protein VF901_28075, partial [Bradyrhizobium sp.]
LAGNDSERGKGSTANCPCAELRPSHGKSALNHCRQKCGAFPRFAPIKPKYLPIRANGRRFLG